MVEKKEFIESILGDINYQKTDMNILIVDKLIKESFNDIKYVWDKIPSLIQKLEHLKGFVGISSSQNLFKISFDKSSLSESAIKDFILITEKWSSKYKISLIKQNKGNKVLFYIK